MPERMSCQVKATELIQALTNAIERHGDREVVFSKYGSYTGVLESWETVEDVSSDLAGANPVLVLWDN